MPIDKYGRPGRIELAGRAYTPSSAEIGYFLADWVTRTRSKSIDPDRHPRQLDRAPIASSSGRRSASSTTTPRPTIPSPTPARRRSASRSSRSSQRSPNTYQVQWRETTYDQGATTATANWTGLFTTKIQPPTERGRAQGQSARRLHHRLPVEPGAMSRMPHSLLRALGASALRSHRPGRRRRRARPPALGRSPQSERGARRRPPPPRRATARQRRVTTRGGPLRRADRRGGQRAARAATRRPTPTSTPRSTTTTSPAGSTRSRPARSS